MTLIHDSAAAIETLRKQVSGTIISPEDTDYETIRRGWNLSINQFPALILVAKNTQDIIASLKFAQEHKLGVSVQSTGHGIKYAADENMLIVTTNLKGVEVDASQSTAIVSAGTIWQEVVDKAVPHGFAPLLGSSPHVGVMGYTLGGGIGWLARPYGLAADSVNWIEIVTPDGELRHASPTENTELFWGLRGGSGNFGVVTAMEIKLYPVAQLYGGGLTYPEAQVKDALYFYRDWVKTLPDEMTSSFAIIKYPNFPQMPDAIRGKIVALMRAAYVGDTADGEKLIQEWLDWNPQANNSFHEMPFSEIATISNDAVEPSSPRYSNELLDELSDEAIEVIFSQATDRSSALLVTEIRHAGGAIAKVDPQSTAIGSRDAQFYLQMVGQAFTPELAPAIDAAITNYRTAIQAYVIGGAYMNFVAGGELAQRTKNAYLPESYARLVALKQAIDPYNLFRYSYQLIDAELS